MASGSKPQRTGHVSVETLARVTRALFWVHPMYSGSGTTSGVSRFEPFTPKPGGVGRISGPAGQTDPCTARCMEKQLPTRIAKGAGKRWCLSGEKETSEAGRCRSMLFQLVRTVEVAPARRVGIAEARAIVQSNNDAPTGRSPEAGRANSKPTGHVPRCAKQLEVDGSGAHTEANTRDRT